MNYKYIYKDIDDSFGKRRVLFTQNWTQFPLDPANTDYQQFKKDIMDGGELQDADGVVMTDAQEFIRSLP